MAHFGLVLKTHSKSEYESSVESTATSDVDTKCLCVQQRNERGCLDGDAGLMYGGYFLVLSPGLTKSETDYTTYSGAT